VSAMYPRVAADTAAELVAGGFRLLGGAISYQATGRAIRLLGGLSGYWGAIDNTAK
jgi:hypothetical protein